MKTKKLDCHNTFGASEVSGGLKDQDLVCPVSSGRPARLSDSTMPDFWPVGLDPLDNQRVANWLLGRIEWDGQRPGWKHYEIDLADAAMRPSTWSWAAKRAMDLGLAVPGLLAVSPIMLVTAIFLKVFAPSEAVLFKQFRPGYLCKPFQILKFRTMQSEGNSESPHEDIVRLTRFGSFLRRFSIDELPQLFNVIAGQMSLVGPRPHLLSYLPRYSEDHNLRHGALPGIAGLAQVTGRNELADKERYDKDLIYINNRSFFGDFGLVIKGVALSIKGDGVFIDSQNTYREFGAEK